MTHDNAILATECLRAWTSQDFASARATLADDVEFLGPLGTTKGADAYIEGVQGFAKTIDRVEITRTITENQHAVLLYDLVTKDGKRVPTAGHYVVRDGKITSVRAYFDPRPLL
jgi:ketosteroid isomerase-like protein